MILSIELLTKIYNAGYMAGHHDTVEAVFIPIAHEDTETHAQEVEELVSDLTHDTKERKACERLSR